MTKQDKQKLIEEISAKAYHGLLRTSEQMAYNDGLEEAITIIQNYEPRDEEKAD